VRAGRLLHLRPDRAREKQASAARARGPPRRTPFSRGGKCPVLFRGRKKSAPKAGASFSPAPPHGFPRWWGSSAVAAHGGRRSPRRPIHHRAGLSRPRRRTASTHTRAPAGDLKPACFDLACQGDTRPGTGGWQAGCRPRARALEGSWLSGCAIVARTESICAWLFVVYDDSFSGPCIILLPWSVWSAGSSVEFVRVALASSHHCVLALSAARCLRALVWVGTMSRRPEKSSPYSY